MYKPSIVNEPSVDSFFTEGHTYIGKKCPIDTNISKSIKKCVLLHDTLIVIVDKDGLFNNKMLKVENVDTLHKRFSQRYECFADTTEPPPSFLCSSRLDSILYLGCPGEKDYYLSTLIIGDTRFVYEGIFVGMTKKELFSLFDYPSFPITNYNIVFFISSSDVDDFVPLYPPTALINILIVKFRRNRIVQFQLDGTHPTDRIFKRESVESRYILP
jgi:hypothetical protein